MESALGKETKDNDTIKRQAVARCLAKQTDTFISASAWAGPLGDHYRTKAEEILETIRKVEAGNYSGGLP
jgi:hypothetical protein